MRSKRTLLIFLTDIIPSIIISILGIYKMKLFINILGNNTFGLYQLFCNIILFVALIDGGIYNKVLYLLYKPNVKKDNDSFYSILKAAKRFFNLIGVVFFVICLILSFIIPFFIKDNVFDYLYIQICFLICSLSNIVSYFFVDYQLFLEVKEKKYIYNVFFQVSKLLQTILEIIMLIKNQNLINILIMHFIIQLLNCLIMKFYVDKNSKNRNKIKIKKYNYSFLPYYKNLLIHRISGIFKCSFDTIIIVKLLGLYYGSIYTVYSYIINALNGIIDKLSFSIVAPLGNLIEQKHEKQINLFFELNNMMHFIAITLSVPILFSINSFIDIYFCDITTSNILSILFSTLFFVNTISQTNNIFLNSTGIFKETAKNRLFSIIINIIVSIVLMYYLGMSGIIIGTIFSIFITEYILNFISINRKILKIKIYKYFLNNLKFIIIFLFDIFISYFLLKNIIIKDIIDWFLVFSIYTILNSLFILIMFKLFKSANFLKRIKTIKIKTI